MDREEMADWAYAEENPGFRREVQYNPTDEDRMDPDFHELDAEMRDRTDAENKKIRAGNTKTLTAILQDENDRLRERLRAAGLDDE